MIRDSSCFGAVCGNICRHVIGRHLTVQRQKKTIQRYTLHGETLGSIGQSVMPTRKQNPRADSSLSHAMDIKTLRHESSRYSWFSLM